MKMEELLNIIKQLANSQGFYGRLLRELEEIKQQEPAKYADIVEKWEAKNFTDSLDFILWLEG
jgi:hypothetical protein